MTEKDLQLRYPYLFAGRSLGRYFPAGWMEIIKRLYAASDAAIRPEERSLVRVVQQKEKFGTLRVYLVPAPTCRRHHAGRHPVRRGSGKSAVGPLQAALAAGAGRRGGIGAHVHAMRQAWPAQDRASALGRDPLRHASGLRSLR
jgi:hypothetical protein